MSSSLNAKAGPARGETSGRVLIASYHFPPDAAVGALRLAKMARSFPAFGWQPYVLTVRDELREQGLDMSRLQGLEAVPIVTTDAFPRLIDIASRLKQRFTKRSAPAPATQSASPAASESSETGVETFAQRMKRYVVSLFVLLPDEKTNWSLKAALKAVGLIRAHRIDWVLTSGPPFSGHVIGLLAKFLTRARWVADFRDPWMELLPERFPHTRSRVSDWIEQRMEAAVMANADLVVATTERMCSSMRARYPHLRQGKFVRIPNSIDTDSFARDVVAKYDALTITYAGTLYFDRTPEPLFQAVQELNASGRTRPGDIKIKLLGNCQQIEGVDTMSIVRRYGLGDDVEIVDRVPYPEALRIMQRSHLLLMLAPERHRLVVPAKIFDYLGSGSTILTLAEPGATTDLMAETQCGRSFSQSDINGIRDYLGSLVQDGNFRKLRNEPDRFSAYDAHAVVGRLAAEMSDSSPHIGSRVMVRT